MCTCHLQQHTVIGIGVFGIESNRFIQFADRHGCFSRLFVRIGHHHPSGKRLTGQAATAQFTDFGPVLPVIGALADDLVTAFRHVIVIHDRPYQRQFAGRFAIVCQRKLEISISAGKSIP